MSTPRQKALRAGAAVVLPRLPQLVPGLTQTFVYEALDKAITGIGPLQPAAATAAQRVTDHHGDTAAAITAIIQRHSRYAAVQGFLTNIGGLAAMTFTVPANITGLALLQSRMVAAIAHIRGYELDQPSVRHAVLLSLLGEDGVRKLLIRGVITARPFFVATSTPDVTEETEISLQVANELINRIAGKRLVTTAARRTPIVGGVVGASADSYRTYQIGRYAAHELRPVKRR